MMAVCTKVSPVARGAVKAGFIDATATLFTPLTDNRLAMFLGNLVRGMASLDEERTNLPFFSAYPQLMESAQARQDAASQPSTIPPFDGISRCVYFHLNILNSVNAASRVAAHTDVREVTRELRFKSICETGKQAPSPGEDDVSHEDLAQVWVASTQRL